MTQQHGSYYLPEPSNWPLKGSIGLFFNDFRWCQLVASLDSLWQRIWPLLFCSWLIDFVVHDVWLVWHGDP